MSQRDFNNNMGNITDIYNSQNATNLVISGLPTKSDVNTSITNNNLNYTTTLLTTALINNNIIANNLLYSTTSVVNTAISNAINLNNTSNVSYINSKISTEVTDRNTAINNNNLLYPTSVLMNSTITSAITNNNLLYSTSSLMNSSINSAITTNNLLYTTTGAIGVGWQFNSVYLGPNVKLLNGFSTSIGNNSSCSAYSVAVGYNAGNLSNVGNTSCCYIGANLNPIQGSSHINSVAIGSGAVFTDSNQIQLGTSITTTNCTNLTSTSATINNLSLNSTTTYNYTTLPTFSSFKNQGFSSTTSNLKNVYAYDTIYNCNSITLPCGVYFINYKFELNYNVTQTNYWLNFGLATTALLLDLQQNKNYCSSAGNINSTYICSNSYCFISTNGSVVYQNVMLNAFDNTISIANLSQFIISAKMTAIRIA